MTRTARGFATQIRIAKKAKLVSGSAKILKLLVSVISAVIHNARNPSLGISASVLTANLSASGQEPSF